MTIYVLKVNTIILYLFLSSRVYHPVSCLYPRNDPQGFVQVASFKIKAFILISCLHKSKHLRVVWGICELENISQNQRLISYQICTWISLLLISPTEQLQMCSKDSGWKHSKEVWKDDRQIGYFLHMDDCESTN
jgi:hypothetical protein